MKKRIFAFILVFMLCFVNVHQVYADAGSLVIAGGSVAGVTAGVIAGPAVVAVFCAMMAFGMNIELTQASEDAGMTKTEFLKSKIQQYCNEAQISANTFNNYILDQANVFENGAISLTDRASQTIQKFCNWLFQEGEVMDPSIPADSTVTIGDYTMPYGTNFSLSGGSTMYSSQSAGFYVFHEGEYVPCVILKGNISDFTAYGIEYPTEERYDFGVYHYNGYTYAFTYDFMTPFYDQDTNNLPVLPEPSVIIDSITEGNDFVIDQGQQTDSITGDQNIYDTSKDVLNTVNNRTTIINPGITIPVPVDKDVTIDVNEYLDIVQDMIDGLQDDIITAIDDATDTPITIEFDPTQDWDPTIEKEDDTELPPDDEKTPVVDDYILPSDFDLDPLKFDLKGFFPFCLPFDVADMIGMLQADPVAPSYTVDWDIPFIEQNLTFTVDLEPYDSVAETCRKMEILLFCVGLAVATRSIFIRS